MVSWISCNNQAQSRHMAWHEFATTVHDFHLAALIKLLLFPHFLKTQSVHQKTFLIKRLRLVTILFLPGLKFLLTF